MSCRLCGPSHESEGVMRLLLTVLVALPIMSTGLRAEAQGQPEAQPGAGPVSASGATTGAAALSGRRIVYVCTTSPDATLMAEFRGSSVTVECRRDSIGACAFAGDIVPKDAHGLLMLGHARYRTGKNNGLVFYQFDSAGKSVNLYWAPSSGRSYWQRYVDARRSVSSPSEESAR